MIVLDVNDPEAKRFQGQPWLIEWAKANGFDPKETRRIEIFGDGNGSIRVYTHHRFSGNGKMHLIERGTECPDHYQDLTGVPDDERVLCMREPFVVPLVAPMPPQLASLLS